MVWPFLSSPHIQYEGGCTVVPHPLHGWKKAAAPALSVSLKNFLSFNSLSIHFQCQISRKPLVVNSVRLYWPQIKQGSYTDSMHDTDLNGSYKIIKGEHVVMIYTDIN